VCPRNNPELFQQTTVDVVDHAVGSVVGGAASVIDHSVSLVAGAISSLAGAAKSVVDFTGSSVVSVMPGVHVPLPGFVYLLHPMPPLKCASGAVHDVAALVKGGAMMAKDAVSGCCAVVFFCMFPGMSVVKKVGICTLS
jgi:hypothetical protein